MCVAALLGDNPFNLGLGVVRILVFMGME